MTIIEEIKQERNRIEAEISSPFCAENVRAEGLDAMARLRIMEIEMERQGVNNVFNSRMDL